MKCTVLKYDCQAIQDYFITQSEVSAILIQFKPKNRCIFHVH